MSASSTPSARGSWAPWAPRRRCCPVPVSSRSSTLTTPSRPPGYQKQGTGYGYTGVKGLNALIATVSTPLCAPVIVATRLRTGSAYYGADVIAAARRHGTRFSITARKDRAVTAAIGEIADDAWTAIRYPHAVFDDQLQQWVSDAEVAEAPFTAFASRGKARQVSARLIVRRVRDANPDHVTVDAQGELFRVWRHHAIFTDSPATDAAG